MPPPECPRKAAKVTTGECGNGRVPVSIPTKAMSRLCSTLGELSESPPKVLAGTDAG